MLNLERKKLLKKKQSKELKKNHLMTFLVLLKRNPKRPQGNETFFEVFVTLHKFLFL